LADWIAASIRENNPDQPEPGEIEAFLWGNKLQYTDFTNRMICAIYGKSRHGKKAANTLFGAPVSPSQEAFVMLLYKNGFHKWAWVHHNGLASSEASEASIGDTSDGYSGYIYTAKTSDLTIRNGG
jgi:hypothetical protein